MKDLVNYRIAIGKTQHEMAELLDISYSMYQKLEYGIVKPSVETIKKFRDTFKDFDINIFLN